MMMMMLMGGPYISHIYSLGCSTHLEACLVGKGKGSSNIRVKQKGKN